METLEKLKELATKRVSPVWFFILLAAANLIYLVLCTR